MTIKAATVAVVPAVLAAAALTARAQVTTSRPGVMTQAQVWVQNRGAGEAVPVALAAPDVLPVRVVGSTGLTLAPGTVVPTARARQQWEYETVRIAADQDAAEVLRPAGLQGWEAVAIASTDQGGTTFLMKRPGS